MVEDQYKLLARPDIQFSMRFSDEFMAQYVVMAFLSHALCEAVINSVLARYLAEIGANDLFYVLEKADVKEKWCIDPKSFHPEYTLEKGGALYDSLNHLTKRRNVLVHNKDTSKGFQGDRELIKCRKSK